MSAKDHAQTKFLCPPRHRVGHHSVDAYCGDGEGHEGEQRQQQGEESRPGLRPRENVLHQSDIGDRKCGIEFAKSLADRACQQTRVTALGAHHHVHVRIALARRLAVGQIDFRASGAVESGVFYVVHDSDYGAPGFVASGTNAPA